MVAMEVATSALLPPSTERGQLHSGNGNGVHPTDVRRLRMYQDRFVGHPVRLPIFEGPLDLLLHLIKERQVDIYDIPIAEITDQYLAYLQLMEFLDIELAGDFLIVAATLLMIKSKMLLPVEEEESEEEETKDPRAGLVQQLLEYKRFKEAAETLKSLGDMRAMMFDRPLNGHSGNGRNGNGDSNGNGHREPGFILRSTSVLDLYLAFREVLERVSERPLAEIPRQLITLTMRLKHIADLVKQHPEGLTFAQLCEDCDTRHVVIVTFLALLEMIRRVRVKVFQLRNFGEIRIMANGAGVLE